MPQWTGFLDKTGSPSIKIVIGGVFSNPPQEFDVIIDTGFSGFISMPLVKAFPLGLPLFGTTGVVLADGTQAFKLTALGKATKDTESNVGVIILEPNSNDVLIGMEFLKIFAKALVLHPHKPFVILEDCAAIDAAMNAANPTPPPSAGTAPTVAEPPQSSVALDVTPAPECVFRRKSTPVPRANRHSFRLKSALIPRQIGTRT